MRDGLDDDADVPEGKVLAHDRTPTGRSESNHFFKK
jgi:hypothetical protein